MIKFKNVKKNFDGHKNIIDDISFEVLPGECLVLLGTSGSGKTTLLKMINRLVEPSSGSVEINGKNVVDLPLVALRRSIGYVFQGIGLFPHLTIAENIDLVLELKKSKTQTSSFFLELVNLEPSQFANRYPGELSGGQQQRVGVARALATESDILLMDEPFGALDPINRVALQNEILLLKKRLTKTIVFVTHDIYEALCLADRLAIINNGKLEQIGNKDKLIADPSTEFVKTIFMQAAQQIKMYTDLFHV